MLFLLNPFGFGGSLAPDDITELDIWWDPSDSGNRSLSGSDLVSMANKGSGGSASLNQPAGGNTAGAVTATVSTVDGIDWAEFVAASKNVMRLAGNNTVYPRGSASATWVAAFRTTQSTSFVTLMMQGVTEASSPGWAMDIANAVAAGRLRGVMRDASLVQLVSTAGNNTDAYDGNTHVIMMVKDNDAGTDGEVSVYLDGTIVGSAAAMPSGYGVIDETYTSSWEDLMVGGRPAGGTAVYQAFSDMLLGDLCIYGKALDSAEISGLTTYLLSKWKA